MKLWIGVCILAALVVASTSCEQTTSGRKAAANLPSGVAPGSVTPRGDATQEAPLRLRDEEPLLLLEDTPEESAATGKMADNSRCHVCHLNYAQEKLAVSHARAGVSCASCHGESDAHIADESWASGGNGTAPDIMFLPEQIGPACLQCHPREKIDIKAHRKFFAGTSAKKVCTDCHGKHRLYERRCKWK